MMYDLATFLPWLLVALAIGGVVGWRSWSNAPRRGWLSGWILPAVLAFAIGLLLAILKVLPGRAGLWLEIALLMASAYIFGCFIGGMLRDLLGLEAKVVAPATRADALAAAADSPAAATPAQSAAAQAAASVEADRLAAEAEKAEADRLAAEAAAKAEADRLAAEAAAKTEADRLAAEAAAKAEADRLAAEAAAKAEADRLAAEAAAKAEADRLAAETAAKAEAERLAAEAAAKAEDDRLAAEAAAKAETDRLAAEAAAKAEAERVAAEAAADAEDDRLAAEVAAAAAAPITDGTANADDRPPALSAPDGTADDLKLIKGIGPKNEGILNDIGVHHFGQIAAWSAVNARWVGDHMAFPGRIEREHWVAQAKLLAAGLDTPHATAVKSGAITVDDQADAPLSEDEANDLVAQLPALMPAVENEDKYAGARPLGLAAPRGDKADDLKLIKGIGKQNEARLHGLGIWHFRQIAAWTPENAKWVGSYLAFAGRIEREQWITQAKDLASGGTTEFSRRAEAGLVKSSRDDGSRGQDNVQIVEPPK